TKSNDIYTLDAGPCHYFDGTYGGDLNDLFITKFDRDANLLWASYVGGNRRDFRSPLAIDSDNNLFLAGECTLYSSSVTLSLIDPGGSSYYDNSPGGSDDSFVFKFIQPAITVAQSQVDLVSCVCDGSASVNISNCGVPPYSYVWSNGAQTIDTVGATNTVSGLCAGNYSVTVTSGCKLTKVVNFTIADACALPIELLAFDVKVERKSKVQLHWTTASEVNNDFFTIERSIDASNFNAILNKPGAGNSNAILDYVDFDYSPYQGISYYRLKQTDFDGAYSYSTVKMIEINASEKPSVLIYPNPFSSSTTLILPLESKIELILFTNVLGELVKRVAVHSKQTKLELNFNDHNPGIYFCSFISNGELIGTDKIILQE
ncbi:MAG: T9SS type A sorting domain-containing protein, partial [Flavobacteriales bacterium]|nr:T9SS type A sorting domain-containing protein [Flavobacteriales bacterium]